ncbi:MAG: class I SAM-dependent methyltransferase [Nitrospirae bacterium]|nr:class I SAM-dependent methyltransferase [Candidatus Manganitrophaceae bacterium]
MPEKRGFKDYFSDQAEGYAVFRPRYPEILFESLAESAPRREQAWDCATGSGQAALGLARHFDRVIATDASPEQIQNAIPDRRVEYRVAAAEKSGLADGSVDLITVAQALHWFDIPAFFMEATRVLVPGGLLAVWCYQLFTIDPAIDRLIHLFYSETLGPYWPPERKMVEEGYQTISFPFIEQKTPPFFIESSITLDPLGGYLRTWSATRRYLAAEGRDPVTDLLVSLATVWGDPLRPRRMKSPLRLRVGRKEGRG